MSTKGTLDLSADVDPRLPAPAPKPQRAPPPPPEPTKALTVRIPASTWRRLHRMAFETEQEKQTIATAALHAWMDSQGY
jgi:hypothetical protein